MGKFKCVRSIGIYAYQDMDMRAYCMLVDLRCSSPSPSICNVLHISMHVSRFLVQKAVC